MTLGVLTLIALGFILYVLLTFYVVKNRKFDSNEGSLIALLWFVVTVALLIELVVFIGQLEFWSIKVF